MTEVEQRIERDAIVYAKKHRTAIARQLADQVIYVAEQNPVSVFMAGSPGAGKTEASKELLDHHRMKGTRVLRIDPDELRLHFPDYNGSNAWLFQRAVTVLVERLHDLALRQQQSFILDGTLSNIDIARRNIERSLRRGRLVQILYVYQEPQQAWRFVLAREAAEGRRIDLDTFITQYFAARDTVNRLKQALGRTVSVDLLLKDNDGSQRLYKAGIDQIDNHVPEKYAASDLKTMLRQTT